MQHAPGQERAASGFALLAILLLIAALTMMVGMSLQAGEDSRRVAAQTHHEQFATSLAESGLERTRSYLLAILESDLDLDRALDPELDTNCATLADTTGTDVDYVPAFTDPPTATSFTQVVQYPPGSGMYYRFIYMGQSEGGYIVRIDDNEDDALPANVAVSPPSCATEGVSHTVVRDRDQSVMITSIGFHSLKFGDPSVTLPTVAQVEAALMGARARRVLRARLTPSISTGAGLIVGGNIDLQGNSRVCGAYGSVLGSGNLTAGGGNDEVCGTNCSNGVTSCTARAQGSCTLSGSACMGGQIDVPPPPAVHVWSSINAPPACPPAMGDNCTPFFYLRHVTSPRVITPESVELYMWNYELCNNPRTGPTIPTPKDTTDLGTQCWTLVMDTLDAMGDGCTSDDKGIAFADGNLLHRRDPRTLMDGTPSPLVRPLVFPDRTDNICPTATPVPNSALIFKMTGGGAFYDSPNGAGCDPRPPLITPAPQPNSTRNPELQRWKLNTTNFEYENGVRIPRGVWFIEGNVVLKSNSPVCATLPTGYGVSLIMTGDLKLTHDIYFDPIHPRGFTLLVGRDMDMDTGNTSFGTCTKAGAIMVHEQIEMKGNSRLMSQVVVEDAATCSNTLSSNNMRGTTEINVPWPPPITSGAGSMPNLRSWSESSL
jgi:hypothetical protein